MSSRSRTSQPRNDHILEVGTREYSKFGLEQGVYHLPVDEDEEERQDGFNRILKETTGSTVLVPFPPSDEDEPAVLDLGFGKGSWIDDLLSEHDDCVVTGVDLFLDEDTDEDEDDDEEENDAVEEFIKKRWNLNVPFSQDRSDSRLRPESFDLINCRCLAEGIDRQRWPILIEELKRLLKPGGYLQMVEPYYCFQSDNGRLNDASAANAWWAWYSRYMEMAGRDPRIGRQLEGHCRSARLERVTAKTFRMSIGAWDQGRRSLGRVILENTLRLLKSYALPFVRVASMPVELCRTVVSRAIGELSRDDFKPYYMVHVVTARRPVR